MNLFCLVGQRTHHQLMCLDNVSMIFAGTLFLHLGNFPLLLLRQHGIKQDNGTDGYAHRVEIAIDSQDQFGVVGKQDQGHEQSNRDENGEPKRQEAYRPR